MLFFNVKKEYHVAGLRLSCDVVSMTAQYTLHAFRRMPHPEQLTGTCRQGHGDLPYPVQ